MGANRLICFRTDGNSQIASGHLVRCFSIALACQRAGMEVCFLVSDKESSLLLKGLLNTVEKTDGNAANHIPVINLKSAAYNHLEQELPEIISLLSFPYPAINTFIHDTNVTNKEIVYFIDSYYITDKYFSSLKPLVKTAYLDDLQLFDYPADLVINYDIIPDELMPSYRAAYQNAGKLLLGAAYTPLRPQFLNRQITIKTKITDILITTGGSDPCHFCLDFARQILLIHTGKSCPPSLSVPQIRDITFHLAVGKLNTDTQKLRQLAASLPLLQLHEAVSDMASLMEKCDLAVSAAGTTLYELCALGIPSVSFTMADNQIPSANAFHQERAIPYMGDIRNEPDKVFENVLSFIDSMTCMSYSDCCFDTAISSIQENSPKVSCSFSQRKTAHDAMRRFVDGQGALRIAAALKEL